MDPNLLRYYETELRHIREMGQEFAREYPRVARRLGLDESECADPYVERLIESFAFLAARVQLKIDAEFPRLTQHLLEVLYPHYLTPVPALVVAQVLPNLREGALSAGFTIARDSVLRAPPVKGEATACEFRTRHPVTLWPIEIVEATYTNLVGDLGLTDGQVGKVVSSLRLVLRCTGGARFSDLSIDELPLFFSGEDDVAFRLHELTCATCVGMVGRAALSERPLWLGGPQSVRPLGFDDEEALLPYGSRSFQGYRLLQEYFAFPARYRFAALQGLSQLTRTCYGDRIELSLLFSRDESSLLGAVDRSRLLPFCTPAINLFPFVADRIHLSGLDRELHIVPDRTRPLDLEVHTVNRVQGFGRRGSRPVEFAPLFAARDADSTRAGNAFFSVERRPRRSSERARAFGSRSSYVGSEVFLSLVDRTAQPYSSELRQLAVDVLCTNRDLPLRIALGQGGVDFTLQASAPVQAVRCVAGPTAPRASHVGGETAWRLVSHLSLNYLALADQDEVRAAAGLRELLQLYMNVADPATQQQVAGIRQMRAEPVVRAIRSGPQVGFARGLHVNLHVDEEAFSGATPYILSSVLRHFFCRHVSINSFVETGLSTVQRGKVAQWPLLTGQRQLL